MEITLGTTLYNEESNLDYLHQVYTSLIKIDSRINFIFVDNSSTDNTFVELRNRFHDKVNVKLIKNVGSRGYGDGYRTIVDQIQGGYLLFFPGDFQFPISEIIKIYQYWNENKNQGKHLNILTVRRRRDGFYQAIRGKIWRELVCKLFAIPRKFDPASQLKMLCRDCIPDCNENDFTYDLEQILKLLKKEKFQTVHTLNVDFYHRLNGKSSLNQGFLRTELIVFRAALDLRGRSIQEIVKGSFLK